MPLRHRRRMPPNTEIFVPTVAGQCSNMVCDSPATTTRTIAGTIVPMCEPCALRYDACLGEIRRGAAQHQKPDQTP